MVEEVFTQFAGTQGGLGRIQQSKRFRHDSGMILIAMSSRAALPPLANRAWRHLLRQISHAVGIRADQFTGLLNPSIASLAIAPRSGPPAVFQLFESSSSIETSESESAAGR